MQAKGPHPHHKTAHHAADEPEHEAATALAEPEAPSLFQSPLGGGPTIADAFVLVPSSADKTAIVNAFNSLITAFQNAVTSGRLTPRVEAVLQDNLVIYSRRVADNITT
jgi:hypothetical protein